jgi:hypothetical protein
MLRLLGVATVAGIILGLFSVLGDRAGVDSVLHVVVAMANATSPWLLTAFAVGILQRDRARGAAAATLALTLAVGIYYLGIYVGGHQVGNLLVVAGAWLLVALFAGPLLGAAGAGWSAPGSTTRAAALSLVGGLLLAEAGYRFVIVELWTGIDVTRSDVQVCAVDLVAAILLPFLMLRTAERPGYLASVPIGVAGVAAISVVTFVVRAVG